MKSSEPRERSMLPPKCERVDGSNLGSRTVSGGRGLQQQSKALPTSVSTSYFNPRHSEGDTPPHRSPHNAFLPTRQFADTRRKIGPLSVSAVLSHPSIACFTQSGI